MSETGSGADAKADRKGTGVSEDMLAACYDDIRKIARRVIGGDNMNRAIQATELANEAAIRLMGLDRMEIKDRAHMLALAARTMRRVLIDFGLIPNAELLAKAGRRAGACAAADRAGTVWDQIKARGTLDPRKTLPKSAVQMAQFCA